MSGMSENKSLLLTAIYDLLIRRELRVRRFRGQLARLIRSDTMGAAGIVSVHRRKV